MKGYSKNVIAVSEYERKALSRLDEIFCYWFFTGALAILGTVHPMSQVVLLAAVWSGVNFIQLIYYVYEEVPAPNFRTFDWMASKPIVSALRARILRAD